MEEADDHGKEWKLLKDCFFIYCFIYFLFILFLLPCDRQMEEEDVPGKFFLYISLIFF